jgi:hypothetical protein
MGEKHNEATQNTSKTPQTGSKYLKNTVKPLKNGQNP